MITKRLNFNSFDKGKGNDYSETLVFSFFFQINSFFSTGEYRGQYFLLSLRVRGKFLPARRIWRFRRQDNPPRVRTSDPARRLLLL